MIVYLKYLVVVVGAQMVLFVVVVIAVMMTASNTVYIVPYTRNVFGQQYLLSPHLVINECSFGMETRSPTRADCWEWRAGGEAGRRGVTVPPCHRDRPRDGYDCCLLNIHAPSFLLIRS